MKSKAVTGIMLILLLVGMITLAFNVQTAKAEPTTWTVDDDAPADFSKIQDAITAANPEDSIYVRNGTYYENVVVNKTLSFTGESKYNTIIDGNGNGTVVDITANKVLISGFTIQNSAKPGELGDHGIRICSSDNNISHNIITNNSWGIYIQQSSNNVVASNIVSNNWIGICLSNYGYTVLTDNTISNNNEGITLYAWMGHLPRIFHNNFIDNTDQGYRVAAYALWDNGYPSGGNYWSDYTGKDEKNGPTQNQSGSDGIGDTAYVFDYYNIDNYPFMEPNGWLLHQLTQLNVTSSPVVGIAFTLDGISETTPYTRWLFEGSYILEMPETHKAYVWSHWLEDGDTNRTKTITMDIDFTLTGVFTFVPSSALIDIDPDTLNLKSKGRWITCYIELPEGYNVNDIDRTTILLNATIPVYQFWIDKSLESVVGDCDNDTIPDLMVKFSRAAVIEYLLSQKITYGNITLTVTGGFYDGTLFEDSDMIRVKMPSNAMAKMPSEVNSDNENILVMPEFSSFLILPLFMIATLPAVIVYRRKHTRAPYITR